MSDEIVERTACKVGFSSHCDEEIPVRIKRCEKYTAYFLLPPKHCPEAYCFGAYFHVLFKSNFIHFTLL